MSDSLKPLLIQLVNSFSYYLIDEARKDVGGDILEVNVDDISYYKAGGRFGDVYVIDVLYSSSFGKHKTRVAIKSMGSPSEVITEIRNSSYLEKKFSTRSVVQVPRYLYVNLKAHSAAEVDSSLSEVARFDIRNRSFIAYEGVTGINYEDAYDVRDKSFWAGYVLSIIHEGKPRPVMTDIYEELYRRLILAAFGGNQQEQEIMTKSANLLEMISQSQGGSDAFGDFHQSNLMIRTSPQNEVVSIALIDPTFWMQGAFDRFEDMGTFFGREALLEFRETKELESTIEHIQGFIEGYNVHLREVNAKTLEELYPKGYPLDFFMAIWAMMDILDKTTVQNVGENHPDILLLKELAFLFLTKQPIGKVLNTFI